jgi:hypothetical protein
MIDSSSYLCCRREQTEIGRQSFQGASLFSKPTATQWTCFQRLSPENKGGLPYIPFREGYRNVGHSLSHRLSHVISLAALTSEMR